MRELQENLSYMHDRMEAEGALPEKIDDAGLPEEVIP